MLFDTHCHLNFKAFENRVEEVIGAAHEAGVDYMTVVGTDEETSKKAVEIAEKYEGIYAAVGVHPHHVFTDQKSKIKNQNDKSKLKNIEDLLTSEKVVAIGEVGIDKHEYKNTKYQDYKVDENFIEAQEKLFSKQIKLALQYSKSLIIHNRRSRENILKILNSVWTKEMEYKTVFHCCEPDKKFFQFAKDHKIFIGVDGDITYYKEKQTFVKGVPLDLLVLETDAPLLVPEPFRSQNKLENKNLLNEPKNIKLIANFIAQLVGETEEKIAEVTTSNAKTLFGISED